MSIVTLTFYAICIIFSSRAIMCHKFGQDTMYIGLVSMMLIMVFLYLSA